MRRSSAGFGLGTLQKSESRTSLSDSSTKGSNLKVGTTLEPEIAPHTVVSPVAESPAREAEASRPSPIIAPSPLGAIPVFRPQETPTQIPVVSEPPAPRLPEPESQVVDSPPSLVDSPQAHESSLPVVEQASGKLSDYVEAQPAVTKAPEMTSREVREEPGSTQPQVEPGFGSINKGFGIQAVRVEEPEPEPVSIPAPEPAPVVIQVPEQQVPPPTQVVSDVRELPLLGPSVVAVPPSEDRSPWASVITGNDNLSSQLRTPPNHPRSLSPKQSRASFAGTVFESVNGSQQSLPRQVSNKASKTSLAPSYTWSTKADLQPKPAPQFVDNGTNGDARTISSARYNCLSPVLFNSELTLLTRFVADDPFVDPPPGVQPIPYLYSTEEPFEYVPTQSLHSDADGIHPQARSGRTLYVPCPHCDAAPFCTRSDQE
jgi:hypothetical protein